MIAINPSRCGKQHTNPFDKVPRTPATQVRYRPLSSPTQVCEYCGCLLPPQYTPACCRCGAPRSLKLKDLGVECLLCHQAAEIQVPEEVADALGKSVLYVCLTCAYRAQTSFRGD